MMIHTASYRREVSLQFVSLPNHEEEAASVIPALQKQYAAEKPIKPKVDTSAVQLAAVTVSAGYDIRKYAVQSGVSKMCYLENHWNSIPMLALKTPLPRRSESFKYLLA